MATPDQRAEIFAKRVKLLRERQKLNQAQLADESGLTPAAISQIEAGERVPAFKTILALAKALETTPDDLMGIETSQLDPSLQELSGLFRDLKEISPADLETVKNFAKYLLFQKKSGER
ncbi:MAG TPA: helix-turn-helix transcriptional regulator [Tepidiformaceae bacterium]|mgnify:FL=1|nr:helix-turn-helix transcriptional regulator [Tepidiformaceae bacterium]